jgi:hypothetical protein
MKIEYLKEIFSKYSNLDFSPDHRYDRARALEGLERRLQKVYQTRVRHGVLHGPFLGRTLLWQRAEERTPLKKIVFPDDFPNNMRVRSWSWMAVEGPIKYLDPPFSGTNWSLDIKSPFISGQVLEDGILTQPVGDLVAIARDIAPGSTAQYFLDRDEKDTRRIKCVIVGTEKGDSETDLNRYVLLVAPIHTSEDCKDYERIGVAIMSREDIDEKEPSLEIQII